MEAAAINAVTTDKLIVEKRDGVGHVVLNQPDKHNAIAFEMWQGLSAAMHDFATDDAVRVVVVSGAGGRAFSAGADISQFEKQRGTKDAIEVYNAATYAAHDALREMPKPTIAKIAGYCIGGGLGVAVCCDLRIASEDSTFAIPAAKLGLGYGYDALNPLVALVGPSFAKEILYTARRFDATEAAAMGLVNRVLAAGELDAFVDGYAKRIAGNAPLTVRAAKGVIGQAVAVSPDIDLCKRLVETCFESEDYKEGRQAFMEKRKPAFKGR